MAQMMKPNPQAAEHEAQLKELAQEAEAWEASLSPEGREMREWVRKIGFAYSNMSDESRARHTREEAAGWVLNDNVGPAYAERMLADPKFRKIADLPPLD